MQYCDLHTNLINRLRILPRLGQSLTPDEQRDQSQSKMKELLNQYNSFNNVLEQHSSWLSIVQRDYLNLQHGLSITTEVQSKYNKSVVDLVKNLTYFDQIEARISKTLGITTKASVELSNSTDGYISSLKTSRSEIDKYRSTLNKILPLQAKNLGQLTDYNETLFESQQLLQDFQGLTADQANAYTLYTEGAGKNIASQLVATKNLADFWEKTTGQVGAFNAILNEVSNLSADIRSEYSRIPGNLELAVLKSKALGMSMSDLDKIGTELLDIEQSVGKEIEYQLISGRRLTDSQGRSLTMRFREAKLMRDGVAMAETMNDLVQEHGDIIENGNYYEKKALADALGMDVESLVLAKQKLELNKQLAKSQGKTFDEFNKLTGEQQAKIQLEYETALKKEGGDVAEQQLKAIRDLKQKEIDLRTPAERTALALESIVDKGISVKRGIYGGYKDFNIDAIQKQVAESYSTQLLQNQYLIESTGKFQSLLKIVNIELSTFKEALDNMPPTINTGISRAVVEILTAVKTKIVESKFGGISFFGQGAASPPSGTATKLSTTPYKDALMMNDGVIRFHPSDKFMRVNDSTMIAGTSIDGNKKLAKSISGGGDTSKLVQAIQAAFAGVQITVNVDPMKIDREIKFRTATINK